MPPNFFSPPDHNYLPAKVETRASRGDVRSGRYKQPINLNTETFHINDFEVNGFKVQSSTSTISGSTKKETRQPRNKDKHHDSPSRMRLPREYKVNKIFFGYHA